MFELLASTLRLSTPLIYAAMGGLLCERSGVPTICLEGIMLTAAWGAAAANFFSHDPYWGLLAGCGLGILAIIPHLFLSVYAKADPIISGIAVNLLASGITPILNNLFFGGTTQSASIPLSDRMGPLFPQTQNTLLDEVGIVYLALLVPFLLHYGLYRSKIGMRLRACGDNPEAVESTGLSVKKIQTLSLLLGALIVSQGGVFLSIGHASHFTRDMTAGRGFIALAAVIFGRWRPLPTLATCLIFGFADALQIRIQGSTQLLQALPYLVTLGLLVVRREK